MAKTEVQVISPVSDVNAAGGMEGASQLSRELATWFAPTSSPDALINPAKETVDARSRDMTINDGYAIGAMAIHKDSIVGSQFKLNASPAFAQLGKDEVWAEEFQSEVEAKFTLWAESMNHWPDASRNNTLTGLVRLAVGTHFMCGEVLAAVEWIKSSGRPYYTAIQMLETDRLCNPEDADDTLFLRRGVERNRYGEAIAYHIRQGYKNDFYADTASYKWKRVEARKPWGRIQMIHLLEQMRPDQTRGVSEMVSVLKQMKMTQKFQDVVLQNAVLNATYAATIESELPPEAAYSQIGQGGTNSQAVEFLKQVAAYTGSAKNLQIDGVKVPHLFPGTKFKLLNAGSPGGVGETFEQSLLRHTAAGLGLSYEQFSRDYTQTNYSSARASANETYKYMQARKKAVADKFATHVYALWLEEAMNAGDIDSITKDMPNFYEGMNKEAYTRCTWIGSSRGQIDELKETQAAVMRITSGLSTFEEEIARGGKDYREVFAQRAREKRTLEQLDIVPNEQPMIAGQGAHAGSAKQDGGKGSNSKNEDDGL